MPIYEESLIINFSVPQKLDEKSKRVFFTYKDTKRCSFPVCVFLVNHRRVFEVTEKSLNQKETVTTLKKGERTALANRLIEISERSQQPTF